MKRVLPFLILLTSISGCGEDKDYNFSPKKPGQQFAFKNLKEIFGFYGQSRYSYCPSVVKETDGTTHVYFCGTQNMIMVDNIYHIRINPDGTQTPAKIVLTPGPSGSWDDHHTCDPSVVGGKFRMNGTDYRYALFFLSNMYGVYYNEIGVAFSNDLEADSWVKYSEQIVKKTWDYEGDELLSGGGKSWGVGQPSAISTDKASHVLLTYTIGDMSGTRLVWAQLDMSNMDNFRTVAPTKMVTAGILDLNGNSMLVNNADFAVDATGNMIVMVRPLRPGPGDYPTHVEPAQEVDYMPYSDFLQSKGKWTQLFRITPEITQYPRNHNAAVERNVYGELPDYKTPAIYYTVSKAAPDVAPQGTQFAEWTYHIWRGEYTDK